MAAAWPAAALRGTPADVIADAGRYDGTAELASRLAGAAAVLMICRPGLR